MPFYEEPEIEESHFNDDGLRAVSLAAAIGQDKRRTRKNYSWQPSRESSSRVSIWPEPVVEEGNDGHGASS